jgi:hypothetical protein
MGVTVGLFEDFGRWSLLVRPKRILRFITFNALLRTAVQVNRWQSIGSSAQTEKPMLIVLVELKQWYPKCVRSEKRTPLCRAI